MQQKQKDMTTQIEIGKLYSYTNQSGYTTYLIPVKVTDKSVMCTWADGTGLHREGFKNFAKYQKV